MLNTVQQGSFFSVQGERGLSYNARNQLTGVTPSGGTLSARTYAGPGNNERLTAGNTTTINDRLGLAASTENSTSTYYTRAPGGEFLSQRVPSATSPSRRIHPLADRLGSVRVLTDETGAIVQTYSYDPYGGVLSEPASGARSRIRYAGGEIDDQGLYHFGARHYDPNVMRWTQRDPLDQVGDLAQGNRYAYVGGDPINMTDPSGTVRVLRDLFPNPTALVIFNRKETRALATSAGAVLGSRGGLVGLAAGAAAGSYLSDVAAERNRCIGVRLKLTEGHPVAFLYNCSSY